MAVKSKKATAYVVSPGLTEELGNRIDAAITKVKRGIARPGDAVPVLRMVKDDLEQAKMILKTTSGNTPSPDAA